MSQAPTEGKIAAKLLIAGMERAYATTYEAYAAGSQRAELGVSMLKEKSIQVHRWSLHEDRVRRRDDHQRDRCICLAVRSVDRSLLCARLGPWIPMKKPPPAFHARFHR